MIQQQIEHAKHGRSLLGRSTNKLRNWNDGYQRIHNDYFCIDLVYDVNDFFTAILHVQALVLIDCDGY
jgi:hypothetical protein